MNGKLYAFRAANSSKVWVLVPTGRQWVQSPIEAATMQVSLATGDVAVLDPGNHLFDLPVNGPTP